MKAGASLAAIAALSLAASAAATADVRYASPTGSGTACSSNVSCSLQIAVEAASDGDEVLVRPGTYTETDQLDLSAAIVVHSSSPDPVPIVTTTASAGIRVNNPGAELRRLTLDHFGGGDALVLDAGRAGQLTVRSTGTGYACQVGEAELANTFCVSNGAGGSGAGMLVSSGFVHARLNNVTAIAVGAGGRGLEVEAQIGGSSDLLGINVIAEGSAVDIEARTDGASYANVDLNYSNYSSRSLVGPKSFAPEPGLAYNQTESPVFADPAAGDFHEHPDSPTIDAGTGFPGISSEDIDGDPRGQGFGFDIGADEFVVEPPPPDRNPPETKILKGPPSRTRHRRAKFIFRTTEPAGATFMCSLDGRPFAQCKSPKRIRVKRGKHKFRVFSIDAAGNVDPSPDQLSWRVRPKPH